MGANGGNCTANGSGNLLDVVDLPNGASVTYTADCAISSAATGTLNNSATFLPPADVLDVQPGNDVGSDTTVLVPTVDLSITKTDGMTSAVPGQDTLTYTIIAANAGSSDDPNVSVADTFPSGLTCIYTSVAAGGATGNTAAGSGNLADTLSLPAGSSVTYTAVCDIDPAATGTLSNTAAISGSVTDPVAGNNSATDDDTVLVPTADLSITKTDGMTSAIPGQDTLTYTIIAANAGPSDDPSVGVGDMFPAPLTCTYTSVAAGGATGNTAAGAGNLGDTLSLPAASSVTYTAMCDIDPAATGTLSGTATISGSVVDPVAGNNSATDDTVLDPTADLSITKDDGQTTAMPGDTLTYTILATNAGPSDAPAATVSDVFPATFLGATWTCAASAGSSCPATGAGDLASTVSLLAGGNATFTVTGTVDNFAGNLINTATVESGVGITDPNVANDIATDTTLVTSPASLLGTKEAFGQPLEGSTIHYLIVLVNGAADPQLDNPGDEMVDVLPVGLTLVSATATSGVTLANLPLNTVTWNGEIPADGSVSITIEAVVDSGTSGQTLSNQATILFDADGDGTNESSGVTDDPTTPDPDDATAFLVPPAVAIPTLGEWGLVTLVGLLLAAALGVLRRTGA